jgi:hypothetical protein
MRALPKYAEVRHLYIERTRNILFGGHVPALGVDGTLPGGFIYRADSSL